MSHPKFTPDQFRVLFDWPVQWGDQDLFGHVNNTVYFRWFESARVDYLHRLGMARLHGDEALGPILAHIGCNFRRQLQYPDTVRIGTHITHIGRTSMTIEQALWSTAQNLALAADVTSTIVLFDYNPQKPIHVPENIRRQIEELEGRKLA
ncbi:MAG TPA: acyl-CoA thioesterase [Pirellulales bacterium]|nr:acyl-CoA thioesterase [Pirellulales bacterium]